MFLAGANISYPAGGDFTPALEAEPTHGKAADHRCPMRRRIAEDQSSRAAGNIADEAHIVGHMSENLSYLVIAPRIVAFRGRSLPAAGHLQVAYALVSGDAINHGMLRQPRPFRSQIPEYRKQNMPIVAATDGSLGIF